MLSCNFPLQIVVLHVIVANGLNLLPGAGTVESRLILQMLETFIVIIRQLLNPNTGGKWPVLGYTDIVFHLELNNKMRWGYWWIPWLRNKIIVNYWTVADLAATTPSNFSVQRIPEPFLVLLSFSFVHRHAQEGLKILEVLVNGPSLHE